MWRINYFCQIVDRRYVEQDGEGEGKFAGQGCNGLYIGTVERR